MRPMFNPQLFKVVPNVARNLAIMSIAFCNVSSFVHFPAHTVDIIFTRSMHQKINEVARPNVLFSKNPRGYLPNYYFKCQKENKVLHTHVQDIVWKLWTSENPSHKEP